MCCPSLSANELHLKVFIGKYVFCYYLCLCLPKFIHIAHNSYLMLGKIKIHLAIISALEYIFDVEETLSMRQYKNNSLYLHSGAASVNF